MGQIVDLEVIRTMARQAKGCMIDFIGHWTAGHYHQFFEDYDIIVDGDGQVWVNNFDLTDVESHCWRHNSGSIGAAMACGYQANSNNLGPEAPTDIQIERFSQVMAVIAEEMEWPMTYQFFRSHAEQADIDQYGPDTTCERWDLWFLHNGDPKGSGMQLLRDKAGWYMRNGIGA